MRLVPSLVVAAGSVVAVLSVTATHHGSPDTVATNLQKVSNESSATALTEISSSERRSLSASTPDDDENASVPASAQSAIRGDGMGWISMAPAPDGEPDLVQAGQAARARHAAEWSVVPWEDAYARRSSLRKGATRRKGDAFRELWHEGQYDVVDARGFSGPLGLDDLPAHYQGSFWKYQKMNDETFRVLRLPYKRFKTLYEEYWEAEGIVDPHRVNVNELR